MANNIPSPIPRTIKLSIITPTVQPISTIPTPPGPIVPHKRKNALNLTPEEKELHNAELNRARQKRHVEKTKMYKKLASIDREEEKMAVMLKLCYPQFEEIPDYDLMKHVDQFVQSLNTIYNK